MKCMPAVLLLVIMPLGAFGSTDSLAQHDTLYRPLPFHGAVSALGIVVPYRSMSRAAISSLPYRTLDDILEWRTPSYMLSTGLLGDWNMPLLFGERPGQQVVAYDGIAAAQHTVGMYPPAWVMPEFMEQLAILVGVDAAILAGATTGTAYWVQQPWYNTRTPYTRVWYCQSAYDFIATDGIFSQNVAPNVNATLGFRRMVTPGRYQGQWLDSWNTRALVRWNPSDALSISLLHRFTNWGLGTNGGLNPVLSEDPTNERTAVGLYPGLDQRLFRHELQFLATTQQAPQRVISASLGVTFDEWNIYRSTMLATASDSSTHVRWNATALRGTVRWEEQLIPALGLIAGMDAALLQTTAAAYTTASRTVYLSPFGYARWDITPTVLLRGGGRFVIESGKLVPILGAAVQYRHAPLTITLDASTSAQSPASVDGGLGIERAHLLLLRAEQSDSVFSIGASAYLRWRQQREVIPLLRGDTVLGVRTRLLDGQQLASGVTIEATQAIGNIRIAPQVVFSFEGARQVPLLYGTISIRYEHRIGRNRLLGELFVRSRTGVVADRFVPFTWAYLPGDQWLPAAFDGGTVALTAELGNATVKLAVGNILSTYYSTLSTFPQLDRHITLSVAWTFFD